MDDQTLIRLVFPLFIFPITISIEFFRSQKRPDQSCSVVKFPIGKNVSIGKKSFFPCFFAPGSAVMTKSLSSGKHSGQHFTMIKFSLTRVLESLV